MDAVVAELPMTPVPSKHLLSSQRVPSLASGSGNGTPAALADACSPGSALASSVPFAGLPAKKCRDDDPSGPVKSLAVENRQANSAAAVWLF